MNKNDRMKISESKAVVEYGYLHESSTTVSVVWGKACTVCKGSVRFSIPQTAPYEVLHKDFCVFYKAKAAQGE